jgi:hypothetical protein
VGTPTGVQASSSRLVAKPQCREEIAPLTGATTLADAYLLRLTT